MMRHIYLILKYFLLTQILTKCKNDSQVKMELVLLLEKINAELCGQKDILLTQMLTKNVKMTLKSIEN